MNAGMKMLMVTNASRNNRSGGNRDGGNRSEGRVENGIDMGYDRVNDAYLGGYEAENRFRDRRGREHYDNGRYAPMRSEMNNPEGHGEEWTIRRQPSMALPYPTEDRYTRYPEEPRMNPIGFRDNDDNPEIGGDYRMNAEHHSLSEGEYMKGGQHSHGHAKSRSGPQFNREMAEEWAEGMTNEDGSKGPHWTLEQTKQVMAQRGIQYDPYTFWVILNAVYSDYCAVAKKHGLGNKMDFYVDMAAAWLNDKDAVKDKAGAYYEYVVRH